MNPVEEIKKLQKEIAQMKMQISIIIALLGIVGILILII